MMLARVELAPEQPAPAYQPHADAGGGEPPRAGLRVGGGGREPEMALEGAAAGAATMSVAAQPMRAGLVDPNDPSTWRNAGRNALCPCGSGRKYKHCHGKFL